MNEVSISLTSRFRVWVANMPISRLLLMWLAVYTGLGLIFAIVYKIVPCAVLLQGRGCENDFWSLLYFSFTTQSTLGYGDYVPTGFGRCLSVAQGFIGLTANALVLGVVVFKALKRSNPIVFSTYLVYRVEKHKFWFRFFNVDADQLRDVDVKVQFAQLAGSGSSGTDYDTQANNVEIDIPQPFRAVPRLRLFAYHSKSNQGQTSDPAGDFGPLILAPGHLSGHTTKYVEVTIRGYFESTGDVFYYSKRYMLNDIRCGAFDDIDNNALEAKPDSIKARELSRKLNSVISTSTEKCLACPHHQRCEFDIAMKTRIKTT